MECKSKCWPGRAGPAKKRERQKKERADAAHPTLTPFFLSLSALPAPTDVCIIGAVRTPIGAFQGSLASLPAPTLGAAAIRAALASAAAPGSASLDPAAVDEVFMGHVLPAGCGQAPTRQAALGAGLPPTVACTGVNKVCASGMKAAMLGAATIQTGSNDVVVAGGMESMSRVPHYLGGGARSGALRLGNAALEDGLLGDGLTCPHSGGDHMGSLADAVAEAAGLSRAAQDAWALESHARAGSARAAAARAGGEVTPVSVPGWKGAPPVTVVDDDARARLDTARVPSLRPAFTADGTITAANASPLSDGAAALVLASSSAAAALGCPVLGHICAYADAALPPALFPRAPAAAAKRALAKAGLAPADVELWEVNEAFAAVPLLFAEELGVDAAAINVHGGAVALGHPLGASGAGVLVRLVHAMAARGASIGCAAICNGGGGASAVVVRRSPRADEG